ncbi:unnamed protein product [Cuscuta europaea]|uniref:Uncharacterized protein n=1 Tax=Cuscuta europaea TaxID=41803 RepID=A0A9P1ENP9_CUSEU|nr:unnamed protein product [Cuscuta europaea]
MDHCCSCDVLPPCLLNVHCLSAAGVDFPWFPVLNTAVGGIMHVNSPIPSCARPCLNARMCARWTPNAYLCSVQPLVVIWAYE